MRNCGSHAHNSSWQGNCPRGFNGAISYRCANGSTVNTGQTCQAAAPVNRACGSRPHGSTWTATCPASLGTGQRTLRCNNGATQSVSNTCHRGCSNRVHGATWVGSCGSGHTGSRTYRCHNGATQVVSNANCHASCGARRHASSWFAACPRGQTGRIAYRCNNGAIQGVSNNCRAVPPAMCSGSPRAFGGLTPDAEYGQRCIHTRCVLWRGRGWCTVRNSHRNGTLANPHPHSRTAWGWCVQCSNLGALHCRYSARQVVSGNWENRGPWYDATIGAITRSRTRCTYTLNYLDGDVERSVPAVRIRVRTCRTHSVCDRIEANYQGRGRWYAGRIRRVTGTCANARYQVGYDDGDTDQNLPSSRVRILLIGNKKPFRVNQPVLANYRARGRYYAGRITRVYSPCCYGVRYNDGDTERCADPANMRRVPRGTCTDSQRRRCITGYRAQANWNGYGRYYTAVVTACVGGSFSLRYQDGDTESMVPSSRLRGCGPAPACNTRTLTFQRGQNVYANYQNRGTWYPGRIRLIDPRRCAYTVYYADGDREVGVSQARLCRRPWQYPVGQRVQANWQNHGRHYPGRITARNADGTYAVTYADGDRETKVPCGLIRV